MKCLFWQYRISVLSLQEGETPVHYAAELVKSMTHFEFEDTDIMRILLQYDGDKNIQTKLVRLSIKPIRCVQKPCFLYLRIWSHFVFLTS